MPALKDFFISAYGNSTIFKDESFLKWYFNQQGIENGFMQCCIAAYEDDRVVGFYGGLLYPFLMHGNPVSFIWGANAYTLPEYRGNGINKKLVEVLQDTFDVFACIGMSRKTCGFYDEMGWNVFSYQRMKRFVLALNESTFEIIKFIGQDIELAEKILRPHVLSGNSQNQMSDSNIIELDLDNIESLTLLEMPKVNETGIVRDMNFIRWRFISNPYIKYKVYGFLNDKKEILSYLVTRRELLQPLGYTATRVIDVYGDGISLTNLIKYVSSISYSQNDAYVDFSYFGNSFDKSFLDAGLAKLTEDDCALLPQVTSPMENRPNSEYVTIYSKQNAEIINNLSDDTFYCTRADSDRDRLAKIEQIIK